MTVKVDLTKKNLEIHPHFTFS